MYGKLDMVLTDFLLFTLLLINKCDNGYDEVIIDDGSPEKDSLNVADMNGDGLPDIIVLIHHPHPCHW